jgi:hypothetical protein
MEWTSVENDLPEQEGSDVLVYSSLNNEITIGHFWVDLRDESGYHWKLTGRDEEYSSKEITHWMSLPEPPKQ